MEMSGFDERQLELQKINEKYYPHGYRIIFGMLLVVALALVGNAFVTDRDGYGVNLFTEVLSILVTVFVLDTLAEIRAEKQLKAQLIREMGALDKGIVNRAIRELKAHNWHRDGSLRGVMLAGAQLSGEDLTGADLEGAMLGGADLTGASLEDINLKGAMLSMASLGAARMSRANLEGAMLAGADLSGVVLNGANLKHAMLADANLKHAKLEGTKELKTAMLMGAILPDGSITVSRRLSRGKGRATMCSGFLC